MSAINSGKTEVITISMNIKRPRIFNRLYLQISAIFLLILFLFAAVVLYVAVDSSRKYSVEVNQRLNRNLAQNTISMIGPYIKNGRISEEGIGDIMHSMMVINPIVEVYLLDPEGKILQYVAPDKVVKLDRVNLTPVIKFVNDPEHTIIYGDDPRNPGEYKTFSAAPVYSGDRLTGYIYIVLASQEFVSASQVVLGSYILGLSIRSVIIIMIISALVGLLAIWFITNKLNPIIEGINEFRKGNLAKRIAVRDKGELDRIGHVFNDMANTIEQNIQELKGVDNLRRELISNVSHDLRTPVASIHGYAETLILNKDSLKPKEKEKFVEVIYQNCSKLKNMVEDLFELSKLEAHQVRPVPEPFSIAELVYDISDKYRIISGKKGVSVNTLIAKDLPLVEADISMIDRVLQNLIDNAIKFCEEGDTVNIEINTIDPEKVEVSVRDSGRGISQEDIEHVFQRYYRANKDPQGAGLGLAIVKKIIELHNSTIRVFSQLGKGTAFIFDLPVAKIA